MTTILFYICASPSFSPSLISKQSCASKRFSLLTYQDFSFLYSRAPRIPTIGFCHSLRARLHQLPGIRRPLRNLFCPFSPTPETNHPPTFHSFLYPFLLSSLRLSTVSLRFSSRPSNHPYLRLYSPYVRAHPPFSPPSWRVSGAQGCTAGPGQRPSG